MPASSADSIRTAAIQLEATIGDVAANLERAEALCLQAIDQGARLIALPEFFTSRIAFDARVHDAVLPSENEAVDMLQRLAREHDCRIGGSMLIADGGQVYNRYYLAEPDGALHQHDKDLPTMWENAFYAPGHDDGVFETDLGGIGAAVCWEVIRNQTARRLQNKVRLVMTGTHWWTMPNNWGALLATLLGPIGQYNRYLSENAPAEMARRLGVPVIQASHCGHFNTGFLLSPGLGATLPYATHYVGCTQIVDARGHVLAQRQTREGPGVVVADLDLDAQSPQQEIADRFWIPDLPLFIRLYWHQQNLCGKSYYRREGRRRGLAAAAKYQNTNKSTNPGSGQTEKTL